MTTIKSFKKIIEKQLGSEIFSYKTDFDRCSTSSIKFDNAIGGGLVLGRISEIYGENSCGKTTLATLIAVQNQKDFPDKAVGYIDLEHSYNHTYAKNYGLDYNEEKFVFVQPNSGDEALIIAEKMLDSGLFSIVIFDSVAAILSKRQLSGDLTDQTIGEVSRLMSSSLPRLNIAATRTNTSIIFINQTRTAIGTYSPMGTPTTTPGGKALRFYCTLRLEVKKIDFISIKNTVIGQEIKVTIKKNKAGPNFGFFNLNVYYDVGFKIEDEIVELCKEFGIIEQRGAWIYFKDKKWNGVKALTEELYACKALYDELYNSYISSRKNNIPDIEIVSDLETESESEYEE